MSELASQQCVPCRKGSPPLIEREIKALHSQVPGWQVVERDGVQQLERDFHFKDFRQALEFALRVGELAEAEDHHPALLVEWGRVRVNWWTHVVKGLHQNDFVMAAKTDQVEQG